MSAIDTHEELFTVDGEPLMTLAEWLDEFHANACCPDSVTAARRLCGCGGSAQIPSGVSRVIVDALTPDF